MRHPFFLFLPSVASRPSDTNGSPDLHHRLIEPIFERGPGEKGVVAGQKGLLAEQCSE
jgi:hypothetical protein